VPVPPLDGWGGFALRAEGKPMSTTMAFVRALGNLLRDPALGPRLVPIVADEARTFGMAGLFRQIGIYSPVGQRYEPEDQGSMLAYREAPDGQLLEEGITEAGALASWTAAATAYSVHGLALLPVYIYYSMFGFQRVGDLIWAAADQRARGFLVGATAGRTTLGGEGLQHQDGSSQLAALTVPNCRAYDPATAGELAVIVDHAAREMLERRADVFYYLTVGNESLPQPSLPPEAHGDVVRGMVRFAVHGAADAPLRVRLLGAGALLHEAQAAAELLAADWQVASEVFSVTSFGELAREAREAERWHRLHPTQAQPVPHVTRQLAGDDPVIAVTDYVAALPQTIAAFIDAPYTALGTDGFGRSDTRRALRRFFEVDRQHVVVAALQALARQGRLPAERVHEAIERYGLDTDAAPPWTR
jgi:pyruvate dehydrogenase E1 component